MLKETFIQSKLTKVKEHTPEQGPLECFVHHNTLHHYENINFFNATKVAAKEYKTSAFMPEEYYWESYHNQEIEKCYLLQEIKQFTLTHKINLPSHIIYRLLIQKETENDYSKSPLKIKYSRQCQRAESRFYDKAIRDDYGIELDYIISPHIFKFFSAYFDFGSAYWPISNREKGLLAVFFDTYKRASLLSGKYLRSLASIIRSIKDDSNETLLLYLLDELGIREEDTFHYLLSITLRFKGWMGFIKSLESHPEWIKNKQIQPCFTQALTILALCEYASIRMLEKGKKSVSLVPRKVLVATHSDRFLNHYLYEKQKHPEMKSSFDEALLLLSDHNRQEILHRAFEKTFYRQFLDAYTTQPPIKSTQDPKYQVICCIDEREESLRRYLEIDESCETFGTAGHFGLPISFQGYFDKHKRALCPINVKPKFEIKEIAEINNHMRLRSLFVWGELQWIAALSSKTMLRGTFQSFIGFLTQIAPFTLDILSPAFTVKIKQKFSNYINASITTRLLYKKDENPYGFDLDECVEYGVNFLKGIGLSSTFSSNIFIMGHGSSSLNNPHEAAHDCGACGGGRGGPNARLMALILNDAKIREGIWKRHHIRIPNDTQFIGCYHNTCSDNITFYEILNNSTGVKQQVLKIQKAANLDAKERSRRFMAIAVGKNPSYYHKKMQQRAIDLRQPRPEYGHATNALCIVGERKFSKQLFLDRRAFLVSYDDNSDNDGLILKATLNSVAPVCSGINLEYYFSYIDNEGYGCGTKLPHNVVSLIGVMNGYQSDLQLGLPWQMVEIHQPIRLGMHVICSLDKIQSILDMACDFSRLVKNEWISLTVHNTLDDSVYYYAQGNFKQYKAKDSPPSYFRLDDDIMNKSEHLHFGHIAS